MALSIVTAPRRTPTPTVSVKLTLPVPAVRVRFSVKSVPSPSTVLLKVISPTTPEPVLRATVASSVSSTGELKVMLSPVVVMSPAV